MLIDLHILPQRHPKVRSEDSSCSQSFVKQNRQQRAFFDLLKVRAWSSSVVPLA